MTTPYEQFNEVLETGDESSIREFLRDHVEELPAELRDKIIFALFEDSVLHTAENIDILEKVGDKGMAILDKLQTLKSEYERSVNI